VFIVNKGCSFSALISPNSMSHSCITSVSGNTRTQENYHRDEDEVSKKM